MLTLCAPVVPTDIDEMESQKSQSCAKSVEQKYPDFSYGEDSEDNNDGGC